MFKKLKKFRVARNIDNKLYIREVEVKNLLSEHKEYTDAISDNDEYEQIDALCDLSVFAVNALKYLNYTFKGRIPSTSYTVADRYMGMEPERAIGLILNNIKTSEDNVADRSWLQVLFIVCRRKVTLMKYDFEKCMNETIKEISSREQDPKQAQEWYEQGVVGKWEKDRSQDPSTLYKADYASCKRKPL